MAVWHGDQEERRQQEEQWKKDKRKIAELRQQLAEIESKLSSSRVFGKDTSGGVIASNHHEDIKFRSADGQRLLRYSCNEAHIGLAMKEVLGRPVFSVSEDSDGNVFVRINISGACVGSRALPLCRPRPFRPSPSPVSRPPSRVALIHCLTKLMQHSHLPLSFLADVAFLQELNDRIMRNEFLKQFNATLRRLTDDKYIKAEIDLTDYAKRFERSLQSLENLTSHQEDQLRKCFRVRVHGMGPEVDGTYLATDRKINDHDVFQKDDKNYWIFHADDVWMIGSTDAKEAWEAMTTATDGALEEKVEAHIAAREQVHRSAKGFKLPTDLAACLWNRTENNEAMIDKRFEPVIHIKGAGGAGKTFVGLHCVLTALSSLSGSGGQGELPAGNLDPPRATSRRSSLWSQRPQDANGIIVWAVRNESLGLSVAKWILRRLRGDELDGDADVEETQESSLLSKFFILCEPFELGLRQVSVENGKLCLIPVDPVSTGAKVALFVVDEAHHVYETGKLESVVKQHIGEHASLILLSDISQSKLGSEMDELFQAKEVELVQVVRTSGRIALAAASFGAAKGLPEVQHTAQGLPLIANIFDLDAATDSAEFFEGYASRSAQVIRFPLFRSLPPPPCFRSAMSNRSDLLVPLAVLWRLDEHITGLTIR